MINKKNHASNILKEFKWKKKFNPILDGFTTVVLTVFKSTVTVVTKYSNFQNSVNKTSSSSDLAKKINNINNLIECNKIPTPDIATLPIKFWKSSKNQKIYDTFMTTRTNIKSETSFSWKDFICHWLI